MVEPLRQWICDSCGELIETPEDGYVIWRQNENGEVADIKIVHCSKRVENELVRRCNRDPLYPLSMHLSEFLGDHGKVYFLSLIDPGPYFADEYKNRIADMRLFLEVYRRLQIPYYEEARIYWDRARRDGFFDGANEIWTYLPENLKALVDEYKDQ